MMDSERDFQALEQQQDELKRIFSDTCQNIANIFLDATQEGNTAYETGKLEAYQAALDHVTKKSSYKYIQFQELMTALQKDIDRTTNSDTEVLQSLKLDGLKIKPSKKRGPPRSNLSETDQAQETEQSGPQLRRIKPN